MLRIRFPLPAALLIFAALPTNLPTRAAAPPLPRQAPDTFVSAGKRVAVERFEPAGPGICPALLLLHGLDGPGPVYRILAKRLSARGYVVFLVHYFDRTATRKESLPELSKQFRAGLGQIQSDNKEFPSVRATFESWHGAIRDAVSHVRRHPRVDSRRIGLVGFSMGGFLAVAAAARADLQIACVAELFGGLPPGYEAELRRMPPTLIIHGERDTTVPVREAHALAKRLRAAERTCEVRIYRGVGHGFETVSGCPCLLSVLDAQRRTVSFLARHLDRPPRANR
jgi:carboxymethylenebutenolidase